MKWCVQTLFSIFCQDKAGQALSWLSLLAEKHSRDHHQPDWRNDEAAWGGMERLQCMSLGKQFLMINYHFKIIVTELVASEQNRDIKNPDSEVTGEKKRLRRKPDSSVLAEEQSVHNMRKTWHRLLDLFSVLSKEQCWKSGRANTIPRTALPAVITLAALCAAQPNRTCKTCSVPGRESAL